MREIMQEAIKCMRHSRRIRLTTDAVDTVLSLRNVEHAAGLCNSRRLKMFPTLPSLPAHAVWSKKKRVVTTLVPETIKRGVAIPSGDNVHASTSSRNENNHHCISGSRDRMEETDCRSWKMFAVLSQVL
ncbi:hypothetical protein Nepgr_000571 [Nepenthes gracilis]|uniref:TATA box binding protein associated factor (TAF) histone-like fold domain-containing protein n=1 Tax=Nepenthes gracilis TaxID=150966 RepID=A0AAD3P6Y0_NEPGR|nr:hypothetical protein Nepgr_000571 [Nepenthes gracilis]